MRKVQYILLPADGPAFSAYGPPVDAGECLEYKGKLYTPLSAINKTYIEARVTKIGD